MGWKHTQVIFLYVFLEFSEVSVYYFLFSKNKFFKKQRMKKDSKLKVAD